MPDSSYGLGRYVAGETDMLWLPRGYQRDGSIQGVVYCHAFGEVGASLNSFANGVNKANLMRAIASLYPVVCFDGGVFGSGTTTDTNSWANTNAQTRLGQAITWLQSASGGGAKTGKVKLFGYSMGHALALTYAQANPANVSCIGGVLPVNDLDDIRDANRGTFRAGISTAWGTAAWTAPGTPPLPAGANPALPANQTNLINIPQRLWYANDDAICTPATAVALIANLGAKCTGVNLGNTGGHVDATVAAISIADVLSFLAANS